MIIRDREQPHTSVPTMVRNIEILRYLIIFSKKPASFIVYLPESWPILLAIARADRSEKSKKKAWISRNLRIYWAGFVCAVCLLLDNTNLGEIWLDRTKASINKQQQFIDPQSYSYQFYQLYSLKVARDIRIKDYTSKKSVPILMNVTLTLNLEFKRKLWNFI